MRQAGLKPSSCNNRIRAVNAFLKWSGSPLKVPKIKEDQRVLPTFSNVDDALCNRYFMHDNRSS